MLSGTYLDAIGWTALQTALGPAMPTGAGLTVSQVEHNEHSQSHDYAPDKTDPAFAGKTITQKSGSSTASQHATAVGEHLYGTAAGVAPGISSINSWEVHSWSNNLLKNGTTVPPAVDTQKIENHSWDGGSAGQSGDLETLQRLDYMIARDNTVAVVAIGNEGNNIVPNLLASNYNGITVGLSNGTANHGLTSFNISGRTKPDIVAPEQTSSQAVPQISGAAALLIDQVNHTGWTASQKTDGQNELAIKSVLMAGATKDQLASWSRTPQHPIDQVYGAGQLSVYNDYYTVAAGEQTPGAVGLQGWDIAQTAAPGAFQTYTFTVPAGTSVNQSIALTWNAVVTSTATTGFGGLQTSLSHLSMFISKLNGSTTTAIDSSVSAVDNVQYLYLQNLGPGTYQVQIGGDQALVPYALAWSGQSTSTQTSLASSAASVVSGKPVTFTATVNNITLGAGTPTGAVQFFDGGTLLGSSNLSVVGSSYQAKFSTSTMPKGTHSITAVYAGNGTLASSTSSAVSTTITGAQTSTTAVASNAVPAVFGQTITFTATVKSTTTGTPTGVVTFQDGATILGTGTLNGVTGNSQATFTTSNLALGSHSIKAVYAGDNNFATSSSTAAGQNVKQDHTNSVVDFTPSTPVFGQSVTLTATVSAASPGSGLPTGSVNFMDGTTLLGSGGLTVTGGQEQASLTTSSLAVGGHAITVVYGGDTNFLTSTSPAHGVTVSRAASSTTLVQSPAASVFGQSITFTATVAAISPGAGVPSGTVTFSDNGTLLGSGSLSVVGNAIQATFSTGSLIAGSHTITAAYSGDVNFVGSSSAGLATTVNQANTITSVVSNLNSPVFGQPLTFTASVVAFSPGAGTPTGTVTFMQGTTAIGTGTLSGGQATFTTSSLPVATFSVTAVYGGDPNFVGSTSKVLVQTVNKAETAITISSDANPVFAGQPVTFTAVVTATPPGAGIPTGNVTFQDGTILLGTVALVNGQTTFTARNLSAGSHTINVVYNGSSSFAGGNLAALTETVNALVTTSTSLAADANPAVFGQSVTFTAAVTASTGTATGAVTFKQGAVVLSTIPLTNGQATFTVGNFGVGNYGITAVYGGDTGFAASSSPTLTQTVNKAASSTTVTTNINPSGPGQTITFTTTVAPVAPGAGSPSGTVVFKDGVKILGTGVLSGGQATLATSSLNPGNHSITAVYQGDGNFVGSASSPLSQVVGLVTPSTTSITTNANPSVFGQSVMFTATVTGAGTPGGSVTFEDGTTVLGSSPLSGGQTTFTSNSLTAGSHSITAVYSGDSNNGVSTSNPLTQVVNQASTTTSLAASASSSVFGQSVTFTATVASVSPGAGAPTGTVTFFDGGTLLGTGTLNAGADMDQATFSTTALAIGSHSITAVYQGDNNFVGSTSTAVSDAVTQSQTNTNLNSNANPAVVGQSITFTASVAAADPGSGTPTGTVTFKQGTSVVGTSSLSAGQATYTTSIAGAGNYSLTATYNGDANFATSTSVAVIETVNKAATSISLSSSANPATAGQTVTFTAVVAAAAPSGGTPGGVVVFKDGNTVLGSAPLSGGQATLNISSLGVGDHSITAVYQGSANFTASTSAVLTQTVNAAPAGMSATFAVVSTTKPTAQASRTTTASNGPNRSTTAGASYSQLVDAVFAGDAATSNKLRRPR